MQDPIPTALTEAIDGACVPMLAIVTVLAIAYLVRMWISNGRTFDGIWVEANGAWAAITIFLGLSIRNDVIWIWRHLINHHERAPEWFAPVAQIMLFIGASLILWGLVRWIETVMPINVAASTWAWIVFLSICFAVWFAM